MHNERRGGGGPGRQDLSGIERRLDEVLHALKHLNHRMEHMSAEMDRVEAATAANTTAVGSAIVLLNSLSQLIKDNVNNPAKLNAIADELTKDAKDLGEAVVANTPAATEPPVEPPVEPTPEEAARRRS